LGQSLASRWNQYSPGPLRRLKKFFSVTSERRQEDWDSESEDTKKEQSVNVDDESNYLETVCELPAAVISEDALTETQEGPGVLKEVYRDVLPEDLIVSEHPDICSQDLQKESASNHHNIPYSPNSDQSCTHSQAVILATEHLHIPLKHDSEDPSSYIPSSSTAECVEVVFDTPKQHHDFNREFYIIAAASDEEDEKKECWQQGQMTQWSRAYDDASTTVNGRSTAVHEVKNASAALSQGLSGKVVTLTNGKLGECATPNIIARRNQSGVAVGYAMALNDTAKCLQRSEDSVCDNGMKGVSVVKPEMDTPVVVPDVDEPDCSTMSVPSIVLDLPPSTDHQTSSGLSSTDSQGTRRPPTLQLHITTACTQSPARKSPVTVQEWVDSLPLHHR
jgi:hypothetical protein